MAIELPTTAETSCIREDLVAWYREHHRRLPWRDEPTAYRVWISEIMLQQTRVATVIDYFERFMQRFPSVAVLADAPIDDVLALWSGLGYYSRARNLHRAARVIVDEHEGTLPRALDALLALPGVGRYTAGAIASAAFGLPAPIVDGNVIRVFSRLFDMEGDVTQAATKSDLWSLAAHLVCTDDPSAFNQAVMELGATVCAPTAPRCGACPVASVCRARRRGTVLERPVKRAKKPPVPVTMMAVVPRLASDEVWLRKRPGDGLFGGMWEPLLASWDQEAAPECADAAALVAEAGLPAAGRLERSDSVRHVLSHRDMTVHVFAAHIEAAPIAPVGLAAASEPANTVVTSARPEALAELGISRLVRKILDASGAGRSHQPQRDLFL